MERIFDMRTIEPGHVDLLIRSGQTSILKTNHEEYEGAIRLILNRQITSFRRTTARSWLQLLASCLEPLELPRGSHSSTSPRRTFTQTDFDAAADGNLPLTSEIKAFAKVVEEQLGMPARNWTRALSPGRTSSRQVGNNSGSVGFL